MGLHTVKRRGILHLKQTIAWKYEIQANPTGPGLRVYNDVISVKSMSARSLLSPGIKLNVLIASA